jgi:hypothetical protein
MKKTGKLSLIILLVLMSSFIFVSTVWAHPGRTDKRGGHYCWTNCKKWGLKYGQYHYKR